MIKSSGKAKGIGRLAARVVANGEKPTAYRDMLGHQNIPVMTAIDVHVHSFIGV